MADADELSGIEAVRTARAAYERADRALLEAHARVDEARAALEGALARGAEDDAERARLELEAREALRDRAVEARARAADDHYAGRETALGDGVGFELLSSSHPLLLLPVRLETRFAWLDANDELTFAEISGQPPVLLVR